MIKPNKYIPNLCRSFCCCVVFLFIIFISIVISYVAIFRDHCMWLQWWYYTRTFSAHEYSKWINKSSNILVIINWKTVWVARISIRAFNFKPNGVTLFKIPQHKNQTPQKRKWINERKKESKYGTSYGRGLLFQIEMKAAHFFCIIFYLRVNRKSILWSKTATVRRQQNTRVTFHNSKFKYLAYFHLAWNEWWAHKRD